MGRTPYSLEQQVVTDEASAEARVRLYPQIFAVPPGRLTFDTQVAWTEDERQHLDGQCGIDLFVRDHPDILRAPVTFAVQERFRDMDYAAFRDITVTEWNRVPDVPGELHKIKAWVFVYGYYDRETRAFGEVVCINIPALMLSVVRGELPLSRGFNRRSGQDFLTVPFDDLTEHGLVVWTNGTR